MCKAVNERKDQTKRYKKLEETNQTIPKAAKKYRSASCPGPLGCRGLGGARIRQAARGAGLARLTHGRYRCTSFLAMSHGFRLSAHCSVLMAPILLAHQLQEPS